MEQKELIHTKLDKMALPPATFADVIKDDDRRFRSRSRPREKKNTLLVYSKDEAESNKVKDKIQKSIDPFKLKIGIRSIKNVKKGILIECNSDNDLNKLSDEIEGNETLKNECEVHLPKKVNPKIIIYRVSEPFDVDDGIKKLKEQNIELDEAELAHEHLQSTKNGTNWIISIDPKSFFRIMKIGKINFGWQRYNIREYIRIKQCYKCYRFGHLAKVCRNISEKEKMICSQCGQEGHKNKECTNVTKCINCTRYNERNRIKYDSTIGGCPKGFLQIAFNFEPRVATIIKSTLKFIKIEVVRDMVVLSVTWNDMEYIIINIYCSPSENLDSQILKLETICYRFSNNRIIIMGDFNAKSSAWSPRPTDERGKSILEFVNKMDLFIENNGGSLATYSSEKGESWIDLTITKNIDQNLVENWCVHSEITGSDHRLISFTLCEKRTNQSKNRLVWKIENMKLLEFKSEISRLIREFKRKGVNRGNLDLMLRNFCEKLYRVCVKCIKKTKRKNWRNAVWWTDKLEVDRSKVRALRRRFQACQEPQERIERRIVFKREYSMYKKLIINEKMSSFRNFLEKLVSKNNLGLVKDVLKIGNIELRIEKIKLANGNYIESFKECRNFIIKSHFPYIQKDNIEINYEECEEYPAFTLDEVEMCLDKMKKGKAPGEDGFTLGIIKEIYLADPVWFVEMLNNCLNFGCFPVLWKESRIVLIPKANKDLSSYESYRPICLLAIWGKILVNDPKTCGFS
ncbi:Putative protein in type-1 retrotransposable element R1DM [Araneus ventricosus]|uniref:CCHC-type domain-containing protein n=1 Tax=Araneus ventricosus TaxID=182803 RepID=A0A4Y2SCB4_ARAVE|nr:Putative protein in type-1 retrotransposable element R1DM [Araneus ventricosus]